MKKVFPIYNIITDDNDNYIAFTEGKYYDVIQDDGQFYYMIDNEGKYLFMNNFHFMDMPNYRLKKLNKIK